ncbi:MAG: hypothetical protein E7119_05505 [Bacteroidales bacterium]|nr:hypothetical protein [Bacteroidales bacterium]
MIVPLCTQLPQYSIKMKHLLYTIIALLILAGCNKEEQPLREVQKGAPVFTASFEEHNLGASTKTYLDENVKLLWHEADEISIFTITLNQKYLFDGNTGDNGGTFTMEPNNGQFGTGNTISRNYAVYPYNSATTLSNEEVLSVVLPQTQEYAPDSFGKGANTMVAATSGLKDYLLPFKNVGGYLVIKLYGQDITVKTIELKGNNGEKLAGDATVTAQYGKSPVVGMAGTATETIALDCGEGVKLGTSKEDPTLFWFVVPPTLFEKGFTVTVTDTRGCTMKKSTSKIFNLERNKVNTMSAFEVNDLSAPSNEIWYTSSDGAVVVPYRTIYFGANIVSNTYENGIGIIKFDKDVTSIGTRTFFECTGLTSIKLPSSVISIGKEAFYDCTSLESIKMSENVTSVGVSAFSGCKSLKSIEIPEGVTSIDGWTFSRCESLNSIKIPEGVTSIGAYAFSDCTSLESISIPESVTSIGEWTFSDCKSLESITIPEGVTSIETSTFFNCFELKSITLPQSITTIGEHAFTDCYALQAITLPQGVTSIGTGAFDNCTSLENVYCYPTTPPALGTGVFHQNASARIIHVHFASLDAYRQATNWSKYAETIVGDLE